MQIHAAAVSGFELCLLTKYYVNHTNPCSPMPQSPSTLLWLAVGFTAQEVIIVGLPDWLLTFFNPQVEGLLPLHSWIMSLLRWVKICLASQ